jgi:NAD(P)-dependent dehydrogenase (short-subunit alcohol dehydrogenase family)
VSRPGLAIVTGGAGGIGVEIARRLTRDGYDLLLVDRDVRVHEVAATLPGAAGCEADLLDAEGLAAIRSAIAGRGVRVLVNNAGITRDGRAGDLDEDAFALVVRVNLVAAMRLTKALADDLVGGAAVVNMSSRAGLGNFGQANYVAAKAGLVGFTRALALAWAPRVRVNAVAPGLIDTPMTQAMPDRVRTKLVERIPAGRIGTPADVADAVAYLASPCADYVTGQLLICCGGRSIAS